MLHDLKKKNDCISGSLFQLPNHGRISNSIYKKEFFFALIDAALVGEGGGRFLRCEKKSYRVVV
ncbi:MAG TPA: hypothetical protein DEF18_09235 [Muricauda sp.]|nr:hypothetical protein [Allomuricauda sp.]HBU78271.1 hypothetical protein [Allomuricauda sp.]